MGELASNPTTSLAESLTEVKLVLPHAHPRNAVHTSSLVQKVHQSHPGCSLFPERNVSKWIGFSEPFREVPHRGKDLPLTSWDIMPSFEPAHLWPGINT